MHFLAPLNLALIGGIVATLIVLFKPKPPAKKHQKVGLLALRTSVANLGIANPLKSHLETTVASYDLAKDSLQAQDPLKIEYAKAITSVMSRVEPFTDEWTLCRKALDQL